MADSVAIGQQGGPSGGAADGDVVSLARALVATPSVNPALDPTGTGEEAIAELTAGWLRSWGFQVERVEAAPGRPSVVARFDSGPGRSLILNGHLDTVGVEGMVVDPFEPAIRDGRLWGRGSADMKGGVAAALAAARDAARAGFQGTLIVALTADEEYEGIGAIKLVEEGLKADAAVVCEPTGLSIMPAHKGFTWMELEFQGRAAHGSRPDRGVDAIRHAGRFLARLADVEDTLDARPPHPLLGHGSVHAGTISGGTAPSVYPESCRLTLERRTLPGETRSEFQAEVDAVLERLADQIPELSVTAEISLHRNGSEMADDHPLVLALSDAVGEAGVEPVVDGMTAWVEAVVFNESGTPALCFGPGGIGQAHAADESAPVAEIEAAHRALRALVQAYLS